MLAFEAIESGTGYAVLALLSGALVMAGFLLPQGEPKKLRESLTRSALALLVAFLIVSGFGLFLQGVKLHGGTIPPVEVLVRYLTMTRSGKVWLLQVFYGLALALITFWMARSTVSRKAVRVITLLALPLLASRSLTSHAFAVQESTAFAVTADAIHLVATGLWGGGLMALSWVLYSGIRQLGLPMAWASETVRRFSLIAIASVAILLATGLYQSWIQVGHLSALVSTTYGKILTLKLILFLGMAGLGAINLLSTKPRFLKAARQGKEEPSTAKMALIRIGAESTLALMVFLVTGLLTALPPAVHALHQAALVKNMSGSASASLTATRLQPAEGASVQILTPAPGQIFTGDQVPVQFKLLKGRRGDHVHAYVDGELMGMFLSKRGTLTGIKTGRHLLELRVVAEDHQTELDARDRIEFWVR